jgi:hypothetical protein
VLRDKPYAVLTLLTAVMYLNMPVLSLGLPLWIVQRTDAPKPLAAGLLIVNMLAVVLFQVRVARRVARPALGRPDRGRRRVGPAGGVRGCTGCPAGRSVRRPRWRLLLAGAAVQVLGEMMHGAAAWEAGFGLAPGGRQGQYQGFFGMAPQIARMAGPVVVTTLLIGWGRRLAGSRRAVPGGGLLFGPVVRWAEHHRDSTRTPATLPHVAATPGRRRGAPMRTSIRRLAVLGVGPPPHSRSARRRRRSRTRARATAALQRRPHRRTRQEALRQAAPTGSRIDKVLARLQGGPTSPARSSSSKKRAERRAPTATPPSRPRWTAARRHAPT